MSDTTDPSVSTTPAAATVAAPATDRSVSGPVQVLLAALSAGAGVIHLAMAPIHASASAVEAAGFALVGWFQLALAAVLVLRPAKSLLTVAVVANLAVLVVWAVSRTAGLPVGAHPGEAESVGAADLTTAVLEGGIVLVAGLALAIPGFLARTPKELRWLGATLPAAAILAATLIVVSPDTANHSHGGNDAATAAGGTDLGGVMTIASVDRERCDKHFNPKAYWTEAPKAGVDTVSIPGLAAEAPAAGHADGHAHGAAATPAAASTTPTTTPLRDPLEGRGSAALDKIVPKLTSDSEADAAIVVMALADLSDAEYEAFLYQLRKQSSGHNSAHAASGDDTGGHGGHMGPTAWVAMTDPAQCAKLQQELDVAKATALKYPTAADAQAAGWRKVTNYVPGIAAHYMNFKLVDGTFKVDEPEMILYDGNGPDAKVVGLSYYVVQKGEAEPTQGFTGDNDHYHRHIGLCVKGGIVVGDSQTTEEQCAAQGGRKNGGSGGWMSHAWVVPGCESPWGVFSGASPILDKQLGERSGTDGGSCAGSKARARYDLSVGGAGEAAPAAKSDTVEDAAGPR